MKEGADLLFFALHPAWRTHFKLVAAVEPVIQKYLDEATKQVKQVMFYDNADLINNRRL